MRLEYTSLTARRQTLPSAVGCSVMSVSQVRHGGGGERGPGALLGTQARGLVLPGADAAGGQLIGDEPVPERAQHLPRDAAVVVTHTRLTPEQLRIAMSRPLGAIRSARATGTLEGIHRGAPAVSPSPVEELTKLADMLERGLLTREEFDQRNLVLHGGVTDGLLVEGYLRCSFPLVAAIVNRYARVTEGTAMDPQVVAFQAYASIESHKLRASSILSFLH